MSSVNLLLTAGSLRLSDNQFHIVGPAREKKPADHNCRDDGEARREDLGWQSEKMLSEGDTDGRRDENCITARKLDLNVQMLKLLCCKTVTA